MALSLSHPFCSSPSLSDFHRLLSHGLKRRKDVWTLAVAAKEDGHAHSKPTTLVTFLGKGGPGKTTASIFAAQHCVMLGLRTCLLIHSQDPTPEYLVNRTIGPSPIECDDNLLDLKPQR